MKIRTATIDDLKAISEIERQCFPPEEACQEGIFRERLKVYSDHFWLLEIDDKIIGFINGMVTSEKTIRDEMFENIDMHDKNGDWQAIFGVAVLPEYQRKGYAGKIMENVISDVKKQNRKGLILTCKDELTKYYEKFGFVSYGVSDSNHGGAEWYDMRLEF